MNFWMLILLRAVIMFSITLTLIRIMNRKQPGRRGGFWGSSPFGLVNYMVIAIVTALTSLAIINNMAMGLMVLGVWVLLPIGLEYLARKNPWLDNLLNGKEPLPGKPGDMMEDKLWRARLGGAELLRELRRARGAKLNDAELAMVENGRDPSFLAFSRSAGAPVGAPVGDLEGMGWPAEPQTVVLRGNILDKPLTGMGLSREWLREELQNTGLSLQDVFLAQADAAGDLYLDLFDDTANRRHPKVREMVYANLLNIRADFMTFALEAKNPAARAMFSGNAAQMKALLEKLKPYLLH